MDRPAADIVELFDLLNRTLDDRLSPEAGTRLEAMLRQDPALHPYYVKFFLLSSELRSCLPGVAYGPGDSTDGGEAMPAGRQKRGEPDPERVKRIQLEADRLLKSFLAEQAGQQAMPAVSPRHARRPVSFNVTTLLKKIDSLLTFTGRSIVAAAACVALVLGVLATLHALRARRVVATLGQVVSAKWSQAPETEALRPGTLSLEQGYAELTFAGGADVIIQAPCRFTLKSGSRMSLADGTVFARVPHEAIGFTIDTQRSSIRDFGTEFGVSVDRRTRTEVHVYKGLVQLRALARHAHERRTWDLGRDRAAVVDADGQVSLSRVQDRPRLFVRELPATSLASLPGRRLDLADIIGGGNGLGNGTPGQGLHPQTGQRVFEQPGVFGRSVGYVVTPFHDFIDGVFIPDGGEDATMTVTSTGLQFANCPNTSGICAHLIRDGVRFRHEQSATEVGRLGGQTYGIDDHPAIGMHANAGVTFDLDRIRAAHGDAHVARFRALCGISETVTDYLDGTWDSNDIAVDFWVLVDGIPRFSRTLKAIPPESAQIDVQIGPEDRFLSLVTTERHPDRPFAWSLFAQPTVELEIGLPNRLDPSPFQQNAPMAAGPGPVP